MKPGSSGTAGPGEPAGAGGGARGESSTGGASTVKANVPVTGWPSSPATRQVTLYAPDGSGVASGSTSSSMRPGTPSAAPVAIAPAGPVSVIVEIPGSIASEKTSRISRTGVRATESAAGALET